jgi:TonB-linked SusC/RagA family outer membrane protein
MKRLLRLIVGLLFSGVFLFSASLHAQEKVFVRGTVTSKKDKSTIPGVTVTELDKENRMVGGTMTDMNGNFAIKISNPNNIIQFATLGYGTVKIPANGQKVINVEMDETFQELAEVEIKGSSQRLVNGIPLDDKDIPYTVQSINTKELEGANGASIDDQLQGRLAGVDIVASSGDPGAGMSIRIRGASVLNASSNPLVVIDQVPQDFTFNSDFDFGSADEEQYATMLNIAPSDIKDIAIMVDAASTANWGTKGANGVISITTKRGVKSPPRFRYSGEYGFSYQPASIPLLSGDQYSMLIPEEIMNATGVPINPTNAREFQYDPNDPYYYYNYSNNTDWMAAITRKGAPTQTHTVSLTGGGDKAKYYTSVTYYDQQGTTIGNSYNRITNTLNLDYTVSDKLRITTDFRYTHGFQKSNYVNVRSVAYTKMPNMGIFEYNEQGVQTPVYFSPASNIQGSFYDNTSTSSTASFGTFNPVAMANAGIYNKKSDEITPSFNIRYAITKNLTYRALVNLRVLNSKTNKFLPQIATGRPWTESDVNRASDYDIDDFAVYSDHSLSYSPDLGKNHKLTAALSGTISTSSENSFSAITANTASSQLTDPSVLSNITSTILGVNSAFSQARSLRGSLVVVYTLLDRYIFLGSINTEGNSQYGEKNRFGTFPSLSMRWRVSNESFWSEGLKKLFPDFSIKGSYGQSGVSATAGTSNVSTTSTYSTYAYQYLGESAVYMSSAALTNLKWATKTEYNIGSELQVSDLFWISFNAYTYRTEDQGATVGVPTSSGFSTLFRNSNISDNNGWDITVKNLKLFSFPKQRISADFGFNIASNWNIIRKIAANSTTKSGDETANGSYITYNLVDNPSGAFYGYRFKGVYSDSMATIATDKNNNKIYDPSGNAVRMRFNYPSTDYTFQPGDAKYEDVNHDGNINYMDVVYLGTFVPKFNGGFGPNVRFKDLTLNLYFNFRYGNKIINSTKMNTENMYDYDNQSTAVLRRWRNPGDITDIPRALYNSGYNWLGSDRFVEDGSFLRLKSIYVAYNLPKKIYQKFNFTDVRIYAKVANLLTWTKYTGSDPEVTKYDTGLTPRTVDYTFGLSFGF